MARTPWSLPRLPERGNGAPREPAPSPPQLRAGGALGATPWPSSSPSATRTRPRCRASSPERARQRRARFVAYAPEVSIDPGHLPPPLSALGVCLRAAPPWWPCILRRTSCLRHERRSSSVSSETLHTPRSTSKLRVLCSIHKGKHTPLVPPRADPPRVAGSIPRRRDLTPLFIPLPRRPLGPTCHAHWLPPQLPPAPRHVRVSATLAWPRLSVTAVACARSRSRFLDPDLR